MYNFRGSAIAKIVGANAAKLNNFEDRVTMYVYEEIINGKKLTEIINETHENVKYLPGHILPPNVVSIYIHMCIVFCNSKKIIFYIKNKILLVTNSTRSYFSFIILGEIIVIIQ